MLCKSFPSCGQIATLACGHILDIENERKIAVDRTGKNVKGVLWGEVEMGEKRWTGKRTRRFEIGQSADAPLRILF